MPIVDVELVGESPADRPLQLSAELAHELGRVFDSPPGQTWLRLRWLSSACYAENDVSSAAPDLPVFVTVLEARLPADSALRARIAELTACVARCLDRRPDKVHVQYASPAAGRQAFGGSLVE